MRIRLNEAGKPLNDLEVLKQQLLRVERLLWFLLPLVVGLYIFRIFVY